MLYDNYKNKILKLSDARDYVLRHKVLFCAIFCVLIVLFAVFLGFKGKLIKPLNQGVIIAYGDDYKMGGSAFSSFMGYEYQRVGTDTWTNEKPVAPGEYLVRGYALKGYGGRNYTETVSFVINKRNVTVSVSESNITYGDDLTVKCSLSKGDSLDLSKIKIEKSQIVNYNFSAVPLLSSIVIYNKDGLDITDYYNVETQEKSVFVNKREISIRVGSAEKEYDGENLFCNDYEVLSGSTVSDESLVLDFNDNIRTVGVVENSPIWNVFNSLGENKSQFYNVVIQAGTLAITKRDITIKTGSGSKVYDGEPLYSQTYEVISSKGLIYGDAITLYASTIQTVFGSAPNKISIFINNKYGENVTESYNITYDLGQLSVSKRDVEITSHNASLIYNGQKQGYDGASVTNGSLAKKDVFYISNQTLLKNVGKATNEIEVRIFNFENEEVTDSYNISYKYGEIEVVARQVTLSPKYASKVYDGATLTENTLVEVSGSLASGHYAQGETNGAQVDVGESINNIISCDIYDYEGNIVTENYEVITHYSSLLVTKRKLQVIVSDKEKQYDGTPIFADSFKILAPTSLADGHVFTAINYSGSQTEVGKSFSSIVNYEISDGKNSVASNYNVTLLNGQLTVLGRDLYIQTGSGSKVYDGEPLYVTDNSCQGLLSGDYIEVVNSTWATDYKQGGYENKQNIIVRRANGQINNNYAYHFEYGTLNILKKPITVKFNDDEKVYDGEPFYPTTWQCQTLVSGHTSVVTSKDSAIDFGTKEVKVDQVHIYDGYGVDKTANYQIEKLVSYLAIRQREVTVKPLDVSGEYNATPLTTNAGEVTFDSVNPLCEGHRMEIVSTKSLTEVGEIFDNSIESIVIFDENGKDVTANYFVRSSFGSIRVDRIKLTVGTVGEGKEYDGETWNKPFNFWKIGNLLSTDNFECECEILQDGVAVSPIDAGEYLLNIKEFSIYSNGILCQEISREQNGNDVVLTLGDYYEVTLVQTKFSINKKRVYVTTESKSAGYDENAYYDNGIIVSSNASGVTVDFRLQTWAETYELPTFENTITEQEFLDGTLSKKNSFLTSQIKFYKTVGGQQVETTSNYDIVASFGVLSVTRS